MNPYEEHVMEHYREPHNAGELPSPTIKFEDTNPLCGDKITITLTINDKGIITAARHHSSGCAISQAATSMLFEELEGRKVSEIIMQDKKTILEEFGTTLSVSRVKCALLGLTALKKALVNYEERRNA